MAEKSLVNEVALIDGVEAAVVAVPAAVDPLGAAVVALDDDLDELLQPRSPMEATIATDITATRLRGTDMLVPPFGDDLSTRRVSDRADQRNMVRDHAKKPSINKA
jgi:hypothetical protein